MSESSDKIVKVNVIKTYDDGYTYEATASSDVAKSTISYKDDFSGWGDRCPSFGAAHPDLPGFSLVSIKMALEGGNLAKVTLGYENSSGKDYPGKPKDGAAAVERYSVSIAGREEHILTNPFAKDLSELEIKALAAISNGTEKKEGGGSYESDVTSDTGLSLLSKIRKGNVACRAGGVIYTARSTVDDLAKVGYPNVNKRQAPPGLSGADKKNWLYIGATAEPDNTGKYWELTRQWEFSPDEWDEDLYPDAES